MKYEPKNYQKRAIKYMVANGAGGLLLDPGLGKTSITLAASTLLLKQGLIKSVLIIAPLRVVYSVWPKEMQKWDDFRWLTVGILHGKDKNKVLHGPPKEIYVINPEGLEWLFKQTESLDTWPFDMLVVDESTKFKHTNTKRFKLLKKKLNLFRRRYILTGSPAANGLMDLFGQIYILDLGASLGAYITKFRNEFFYPTGYGGYDWKIKDDGEKRIYDKVSRIALRMSAEDYLELPEKIEDNVVLELEPKARTIYNNIEKEFIHELDTGVVKAGSAAIATSKIRQVAAGGVYLSDKDQYENIHMQKAEAVRDLVEQMQGQPALIAYEFKHDLERLRKVFGKDVPYIGGGVSAQRGRELENLWNAGELPVLCLHPQSAAHGLNLQESGHAVIWHTLTWNYELYDQLNRRVWRQGQKKNVFIYHIIMENTIDVAVYRALQRKNNTQETFFSQLQAYYLKNNEDE